MISQAEGGVVELDAHTGEVKMLWKTGGASVDAVAVSHDARRVFVSSTESDEVTIIDRLTVVPTRVATGRRPTGLAVTPDGRELWVANSGENTISVIKGIRRPREIERFPSGGMEPVKISFHAGRNEAWISNRGSRTVTVLDVASAAQVAEISLPGEPHTVTFSNDGHHAYVSSPGGHQVFTIDVESRALIGSLDTGSRPSGLAWSRHGNR